MYCHIIIFHFFTFFKLKKKEFLHEDEEKKSVCSGQGMSLMTDTTCSRSTDTISLTCELIEQNDMVNSTDDKHVQNVCNIEKFIIADMTLNWHL